MGFDDPEPNTGPSRRLQILRRQNGAGTSNRPFCINRANPPRPSNGHEDEDDESDEERLRRLRRQRERMHPQCGTMRVMQEEHDKEEREKYPKGRISPPMLTRKVKMKKVMNIEDLWDESKRHERAKRMIIIIRGPPLCGKSYLSKRIETNEMNFSRHNKICIVDGVDINGDPRHKAFIDKFDAAIFDNTKFIILELKFLRFGDDMLKLCLKKGKEAKYKIFGIDLFVNTDHQNFMNFSQNIPSRSDYYRTVRDYLRKMEEYPMPDCIQMLNPFSIYESDYKIQFLLDNQTEKVSYETTSLCDEDHNVIKEFATRVIEDEKVIAGFPKGLENSVNIEQELAEILADLLQNCDEKFTKSTTDLYLEKLQDLKVDKKNVKNYNHKHLKTFEEEISEFKVAKVFDHRHKTNSYLNHFEYEFYYEDEVERIKENEKEMKRNWYKAQARGPEEMESNSSYPKNWEKIEVEREKPIGKRKKKKNEKIRRVLDELQTINTVRKRVKRLKIEDPPSTPMDLDPSPSPPQNFHISQLLQSTILSNVDDDTKVEYLDYIKSFYERLDKIPQMTFVLRLIVQANLLQIFFFFDENFPPTFCRSDKVSIAVSNRTESEIISDLAHQMTHLGMALAYGNDGKPYHVDDEDRKDEIERILFEIELKDENHEMMENVLRIDESRWNFEVIGACAEMIARGEKEILMRNYESLWKFYEKSLEDVEKFYRKFDDCSRGSCLGVK